MLRRCGGSWTIKGIGDGEPAVADWEVGVGGNGSGWLYGGRVEGGVPCAGSTEGDGLDTLFDLSWEAALMIPSPVAMRAPSVGDAVEAEETARESFPGRCGADPGFGAELSVDVALAEGDETAVGEGMVEEVGEPYISPSPVKSHRGLMSGKP